MNDFVTYSIAMQLHRHFYFHLIEQVSWHGIPASRLQTNPDSSRFLYVKKTLFARIKKMSSRRNFSQNFVKIFWIYPEWTQTRTISNKCGMLDSLSLSLPRDCVFCIIIFLFRLFLLFWFIGATMNRLLYYVQPRVLKVHIYKSKWFQFVLCGGKSILFHSRAWRTHFIRH